MQNLDITENVILIDWLSVTFFDITKIDVIRLLGLDDPAIDWDDRLAFRNGYPRQCTWNNICIAYGADKAENYTDDSDKTAAEKVRLDMGISLTMSGNGCRAFETYGAGNWIQLLTQICNMDTRFNITRLDLAFDDHTGLLDIWRIAQDVRDRNYTGSPKKSQILESDDQTEDLRGLTIYVGSQKSKIFTRIYDKAAERGYKDKHWIRVELQLRHERAMAAIAEILQKNDVGKVFAGVLRNYCCFREPGNDSNKSRWAIADYWDKLLNGAERIRLWISPGEPYNFRRTEEHMINQYGQALQAYERIHGNIYELIRKCREAHPMLKKKYQVAIDTAKMEQKMYQEQLRQLRQECGISDEYRLLDDQMDMAEIFGDALLPPMEGF